MTSGLGLGRMLRSLPWPLAEALGALLSGAISVFVIARLIGVEAFGAGSVALVIVVLLQIGVNSLVHDALVRTPDLEQADFDVGFTAALILALIFVVLAAAAAPLIAGALNTPRIATLILLFLPLLPMAALSETLKAVRRRALDFRTVAHVQIAGSVVGGLLGVLSAFLGAGVWSLVIQYLVSSATIASALLMLAQRVPRFRIAMARLAPMLRFCGPIIASQLLSHATTRMVLIGVANWHGILAAGQWSMTIRITESLFGGVLQAAYNVGLSHFSLHQTSRSDLAVLVLRTQGLAMIVALPILAGFAAASQPLIVLLLGPAWSPVAWLLLGPLAASLILIRRMPPAIALRAIGNSTASFSAASLETAIILIGMLAFGQYSMLGVTFAVPCAALGGALVLAYETRRAFCLGWGLQVATLLRDTVIALIAYAIGRTTLAHLPDEALITQVLAAGLTASFAAAAMITAGETKLVKLLLCGSGGRSWQNGWRNAR